ncbi:MAG TPA: DUF2946 family protein [Steroidobacteraceae bacterium]|nr:DUF2946 family protein [Steroidobacteraceae bacterium]
MSLHTIRRSCVARHWIGALAVLVLAMRAAVPTGFMVGQAGGHLSFVLCPVVGSTLALHGVAAESSKHLLHHHSGGAASTSPLDAHAAHHLTAAASCPFALATGAALLSQVLKTPDPYYTALRPVLVPAVHSYPAAPPPRHQAPRGPPALV